MVGNGLRAPRAVVLGPQPGEIELGPALQSLDLPPGPVAAITVGWRETEPVRREVETELERCGFEPAPLHLGERVGRAFGRDPELADEHRVFQEELRAEENLYTVRLREAFDAARAAARLTSGGRYRAPYLAEAWNQILAADRFHLDNQAARWRRFFDSVRPGERPALREEREAMEEILDRAAALVLTGGHVAVIRNRLLLCDLADPLARLPILTWSAGAMALAPRIVLFHDRLPHGSARPEIFGEGLGVLPGVAFLPDAARRLDLEDRENLRELAGRVAPERAVLLDPGDQLRWDGTRWTAPGGIRVLESGGEVETVAGIGPSRGEGPR